MKPVHTDETNTTFTLPGGTEANDLPLVKTLDESKRNILVSTWELDDEEREKIANGGKVELVIWGEGHPPVSLAVY